MDDIERLRRWIEDPPELATPQDVLSMLASLTSLTDELQRLRGERDEAVNGWQTLNRHQNALLKGQQEADKARRAAVDAWKDALEREGELRAALEYLLLQVRTVERTSVIRESRIYADAEAAIASHTGDTEKGVPIG